MKSILNARSAIDYSLSNVLFLTDSRLECPSLEPMRRHRHDRWHPRAHRRQTRPRNQSHRHRRPRPHDCRRLALSEDRRRAPHPPGPANDLGTESSPAVKYAVMRCALSLLARPRRKRYHRSNARTLADTPWRNRVEPFAPPHRPLRHSRSEEHTSELQSPCNLVCRLLLEKKKQPLLLPSSPASAHRPRSQWAEGVP